MARGQSRRKPLSVPGAEEALNRLKYEIAAELGIPVAPVAAGASASADAEFAAELGGIPASAHEAYWGHVASRDAGAVGGQIVRRLVQQAQLGMGKDAGLSIDSF